MLKTEDVKRELADIVANVDPEFEPGDGCKYRWSNGDPKCIVGHLLARLEPDVFSRIDPYDDVKNGHPFDVMLSLGAVEVESGDLASALTELQDRQDAGKTWSDAVEQSGIMDLPWGLDSKA